MNHKAVEDDSYNLLEILLVITKRKLLIIGVCCLAAVVSAAYSLTLPNTYSATAKVLPPQKEANVGLSSMLNQMGGLAGLASGAFSGGSDLYVALLKSRSAGEAVINRLDLGKVYQTRNMNECWQALNDAIKVQVGKDGIISITATDKDPKLTALLANTYVEELGRMMVRLNLTKVGSERLFLEKRLEVVKKDLSAVEEELKSFAQKNKIVQVDSQAGASLAGITRLKTELSSKETQLAVLRSTMTDENPEVKALLSAVKRLKSELAAQAGSGGGGEGVPAIGNVPALGLEYARKQRELKTQEALYEQLTKQYEVAKLSEAKDSSSLQVLDEALVPEVKAGPRRSRMVLLSTLGAFFCSLFLAFIVENLQKMQVQDRLLWMEIKKQTLSLRPGRGNSPASAEDIAEG